MRFHDPASGVKNRKQLAIPGRRRQPAWIIRFPTQRGSERSRMPGVLPSGSSNLVDHHPLPPSSPQTSSYAPPSSVAHVASFVATVFPTRANQGGISRQWRTCFGHQIGMHPRPIHAAHQLVDMSHLRPRILPASYGRFCRHRQQATSYRPVARPLLLSGLYVAIIRTHRRLAEGRLACPR